MIDQRQSIPTASKNGTTNRLHRSFMALVLICGAVVIYTRCNEQLFRRSENQTFMLNNITQNISKRRPGAPYLAYIISAVEKRRNFTMNCLKERLPGYFKIIQKSAVPHNDSRIVKNGDKQVSALLLAHIDLWTEFGSKPEAEYLDDDWFFIFEDDVDIVPTHIINQFYPTIYQQWLSNNSVNPLRGN